MTLLLTFDAEESQANGFLEFDTACKKSITILGNAIHEGQQLPEMSVKLQSNCISYISQPLVVYMYIYMYIYVYVYITLMKPVLAKNIYIYIYIQLIQ